MSKVVLVLFQTLNKMIFTNNLCVCVGGGGGAKV